MSMSPDHLVFVPGTWCCPKCQFTLVQSNLNAADGSVTARDEPGDKCPNCDSPLWRVSWKQQAKEMGDRAEKEILRSQKLDEALALAIRHIEHMALWIGKQNAGYSFDSLSEDLPGIVAARSMEGAVYF
jgi:hypothetical protein